MIDKAFIQANKLQGARVLLLGFGKNHEKLGVWLKDHGAILSVRDESVAALEKARELFGEIEAEQLPLKTAAIQHVEYVFRTPGVPIDSPSLEEAAREGICITSQTALFLSLCPAKTIGITGTKGKGTTSSLLALALKEGYTKGKTFLGGNIGVDPFDFLDQVQENDLVVLELSSYQLEDLEQSVDVAIMLRVDADHLDHHGSIEKYREAKMRLLEKQKSNGTLAILNAQYPEFSKFAAKVVAEKLLTYHTSEPRREGAWVDTQNGQDVLFFHIGDKLDSFDITDRKLRGRHNLENILPATLAAAYFGIETNSIAQSMRKYTGLPHRISVVPDLQVALQAYDDSIATTAEAAIVSLKAMPENSRIHLVVGGKDGGVSLSKSFYDTVVAKVSFAYVLPGPLQEEILAALQNQISATPLTINEEDKATMGDLATLLEKNAKSGDVVLLAPAAKSVQPYANYAERGDAFQAAVQMVVKLKGEDA